MVGVVVFECVEDEIFGFLYFFVCVVLVDGLLWLVVLLVIVGMDEFFLVFSYFLCSKFVFVSGVLFCFVFVGVVCLFFGCFCVIIGNVNKGDIVMIDFVNFICFNEDKIFLGNIVLLVYDIDIVGEVFESINVKVLVYCFFVRMLCGCCVEIGGVWEK